MLDGLFNNWWRVGGIAGILYLILFFAGFGLTGEAPTFDEPVDEIRDWFADNGEQYLVGDYLTGLAFVLFFLPFLASLRGLLARVEGEPAVWSWVAFSGGLALLIIGGIASLFWATLAYGFGVAENADEETVRTLMYLDVAGFAMLPLGFVPFVLGASLVILRTGVLWRWLSFVGLIVAVFSIIAGASTLTSDPDGALGGVGFIGFIGLPIWILLVSINMILKREAPASA